MKMQDDLGNLGGQITKEQLRQSGGGHPPLLLASSIDKTFGTTKALSDVNFVVHAAEIVGLMGGNGAGKSTLAKIIGGLISPDSGNLVLFQHKLESNHSPRNAMALGLRYVHQELSLCKNLRVFENFAIELSDIVTGVQWKSKAIRFARDALEEVFPGHGINPSARVESLSLSQQQMVEIARAVSHPATRLVIMDEPTSSLGSREADQLRSHMKRQRSNGMAFIFISHRLHETLELADRITVLRNGKVTWTGVTKEIGPDALVEMLGGRSRPSAEADEHASVIDSVGRVEITLPSSVGAALQMRAYKGEILGLAGLEGNGQRQILHDIFNAAHRKSNKGIRGKVSFVSGDRAVEGIFNLWSINENITISCLDGHSKSSFISLPSLSDVANRWVEKLKVRAPSAEASITSLSGGNQQKVVIARALASEADVVLLDDPTRGVDLGTKADLYTLFHEMAAQGRTIIWYSTDDSEFRECDRTLVFRNGAVVAELEKTELSLERLVEASFREVEKEHADKQSRVTKEHRQSLTTTLIPFLTLLAVLIPSALLNPLILSPFGMSLVFGAALALTYASISQLFIIAGGDIDLGLGSFIGLVNVIAATWLVTDPWWAALSFTCILVAYPVMGLFIDARRVPAIIVTLGLSFVWLGLASLRLPRPGGSAPDWIVDFLRIKLPLIPVSLLICILPAVAAYFVLFVWRYGTVLRGFGASPHAIAAAGWSTKYAKATLYGFAGLFAFLAGIVVTANTRGGDPTGSTSMTLLSVAAVILGGAAFSGGAVAPLGALFGTLTLVFVGMLLSLLGVNAVYLPLVQGLLLLSAVAVRSVLATRPS